MTDQRYNGWANYETWAVGMYLDGNYTGEGTYRAVLELVGEEINAYADEYEGEPELSEAACRTRVADALQRWFDDELYADDRDMPGIVADLLRAAIDEINWRELAEAKLTEVAEVES